VKRLRSLNLEAIRRPTFLISVGGVILLALLWWFLWMSPQGSKLATIHTQIAGLQQQFKTDETQLALVKQESQIVKQNAAFLTKFSNAVPSSPDQQVLTTQIYNLAKQTGVQLTSFSDNTLTPPAKAGLGVVPVQISITGTHKQCLAFLDKLYVGSTLPRLLTVDTFTPTPAAATGTGAGSAGKPISIVASDTLPYSFTIAAVAYYYPSGTAFTGSTTAAKS
jgi:Tfp pilus assembly protein PilO